MKTRGSLALSVLGMAFLPGCSEDTSCDERLDCHVDIGGGTGGASGDVGSGGSSGAAGDPGSGGSGGASGSGSVARITISPMALSAGWFNIAYSAQLSATGGTGEGFTWSVSSGDLSTGLVLGEDGLLAGTPSQEGTYTFEVTVADSAENTASASYSVQIDRKRWVAYVSDEILDGQQLMWVADVTTALLPKTALTPSAETQPTSDVSGYEFSPDGRWLAYAVDRTTDGVYDLYVTDLSGATAGSSVKVNTEPGMPIRRFVWSPDSTKFAFVQGSPAEVRVADVSSGQPLLAASSITIANAASVVWASNSILLIRRYAHPTEPDSWSLVLWEPDRFGPIQETTFDAELEVIRRNLVDETALFSSFFGNGFVVDFSDNSVLTPPSGGFLDFAPDLRVVNNTVASNVYFYRTADLESGLPMPFWEFLEPLRIVPVWGANGLIAGLAGMDTVTVARFGETVEEWTLPGSLAASRLEFSPSAEWLRMDTGSEVWLTRLSDQGLSEPRRVNTTVPVPDQDQLDGGPFAPNSKALLYFGAQETSGQRELYVVDVEPPGQWRKLNGLLEPGGQLKVDRRWSADSSRVAYLAELHRFEGGYAAGTNLYVVDMLDPTAKGRPVATTACVDSGTGTGSFNCREVASFEFQP